MLLVFRDFEFDTEPLRLRRGGHTVDVHCQLLRLLAVLAQAPGRVVTKQELIERIWEGRPVSDGAISVAVARLREILGDSRPAQAIISTVYGRGYRFVPQVVLASSSAESLIPQRAGSLFVGRDDVLRRLGRALRDARDGYGRVCVIHGEPGIGKTRVVEELERACVSAPTRVAWGLCRASDKSRPLSPWLRVCRDLVARGPSSLRARFVSLREHAQARWRLRVTEAAAQPLVEPLVHTILNAVGDAPWLIVIEDLHHADPSSLAVFRRLAAQLARKRVCLVGTLEGRLQGLPWPSPAPLERRTICYELIELKRFGPADVATYVNAHEKEAGNRLAREVFALSGGNPALVAELVRQARDRPEQPLLDLPDAGLGPISRRLQSLDPELREVLSSAAVIGLRFEFWLLRAITRASLDTLMRRLGDAVAAKLLTQASRSQVAFSFDHELLQHALYRSLPPHERRRLHHLTALALEERAFRQSTVVPSKIMAGHLAAALPDTDLQKAVRYCDAAANVAAALGAHEEAKRFLRHALDALRLWRRPDAALKRDLELRLRAVPRVARVSSPAEEAPPRISLGR